MRFLEAWILGIAGVGAPMTATGASRSSTSSISLSSASLVPSEICDMFPDTIEEFGVAFELRAERRERGDGESRVKDECTDLEGVSADFLTL